MRKRSPTFWLTYAKSYIKSDFCLPVIFGRDLLRKSLLFIILSDIQRIKSEAMSRVRLAVEREKDRVSEFKTCRSIPMLCRYLFQFGIFILKMALVDKAIVRVSS